MSARKVAAWSLLVGLGLLILGWVVFVNIAWVTQHADLGAHEVPFWPGGAAIMTDFVVLFFSAFMALAVGVPRLISWAIHTVREA